MYKDDCAVCGEYKDILGDSMCEECYENAACPDCGELAHPDLHDECPHCGSEFA